MKRRPVGIATAVGLVGSLVLGVIAVRGADWPTFGRDATRNAVSPEKGPPLHWQVEQRENGLLVQPAWNVLWEAQHGSDNIAPPVIANGLVWIGTNNERPRDPRLKNDAAVLMCFRESDGKFLWQYVSPRLDDSYQDFPQASINCSPLVEGDRLWFTTNRGEVVCLDVGPLREGKGEPRPVWKLDMRKDLGVCPVGAGMNIGFTCSIGASYKGRICVTTGNGVAEDFQTVAAPQAPSLLCLDKDTGKVLWTDSSPGKNILHSQWSSPLLVELHERAQVIAAQGDGWVRSFDVLTGQLIWKFDTNPKAAEWKNGRGDRNAFVATPVFCNGRVYIANGSSPANFSARSGRLWCLDPTKQGDVSPELDDGPGKGKPNSNSAGVWCFDRLGKKGEDRMHGTLSSVAVHDGLVIAPDCDGYIHCLDAESGKKYWTHDPKATILASPLIVDGKVYVADENGMVAVLALSKEKRLLAENDLENSARSSPVFANGTLYVAAGWKLYALKAGGPDGKVSDRPPGHWPQWRGASRSAVLSETGLLKKWPDEGPPLAWKAQGLGEGVASVAVAGGRVYTLGYLGNEEHVTALEEVAGKQVWSVRIGPAVNENPSMRWLSQRTPTVDDDRLYAFTTSGDLICLRTADGAELWRKNYAKDFEGKRGSFGWCDRPLVDGDRLICTPGGAANTVVALNKKTGELLWKCAVPGGPPAEYSATVVSEGGGVRQYVVVLRGGVVGVAARDGEVLWRYDKIGIRTATNYTPLVRGDLVFCASGYGTGMALLKLSPETEKVRVEEVYFKQESMPPWHDATVLVGDHVFAGTTAGMACLDLGTGTMLWKERGEVGGTVSVAAAEGHLYLRSQQGKVALVEATPKGHLLKGLLQLPGAAAKAGSTAPVIAGGRLFLRDDDVLFCYDVKEGATVPPARQPDRDSKETPPQPKPEREAHDVFVPTPQDVVEKMLALAVVKRDDVVCDLGCGDGRIVVTAARKYGCKAIGYDIDPECIKLSKENVRKHDVGRLVTIEQKDIFTVDVSQADVIVLYLTPRTMERLLPQLGKLQPGTRIVSHAFAFPGIPPDRVETPTSKEDELAHKIYLWTTPLKRAGQPK
jgi:outer membrane protein assembly factor BamB/precorrin-6B methylase 2